MEIVEVKQNWPDDLVKIDITLGNFCNYKCWYCWPSSHAGTHKWPEFDLITKNLCHLLDHYLANTSKKRFDFHLMGGEITHWPKFFEFIKFFKTRYDCIFTLTTNASKSLEFWEEAVTYLDYVIISVHHQFCDPEHIKNVADLIYKNKVIVNAMVLMDPFVWDKCMNIIETLKTSKYSWSIKYLEIIHETVNYTDEQKQVLSKLRARKTNIFWFLIHNKSFRSAVKVKDTDNKWHKVKDSYIVLERLNNFMGWECTVGVNWIAIKHDGTVSGICGNGLFENNERYNIFSDDFTEKFNPIIKNTICNIEQCWCLYEANMPKRKVIPIHAN
jgi:MoaA/NifB/PqqE/SkfB family radical SAM enzyme